MIKTTTPRIDRNLDDFMEDIAREMRMRTGRDISKRRVSSAIPRVPGLREALINSNWVDERKFRRKKNG